MSFGISNRFLQRAQKLCNFYGTFNLRSFTTHHKTGEPGVDLVVGGSRVERVVDVVGDVGGEAPVVDGVLEEVEDGHGRVGEAVNEDRLQKPLRVVEGPAGQRNPAKFCRFGRVFGQI